MIGMTNEQPCGLVVKETLPVWCIKMLYSHLFFSSLFDGLMFHWNCSFVWKMGHKIVSPQISTCQFWDYNNTKKGAVRWFTSRTVFRLYLFQHLELEEQLVLSLRAQHPLAVGCGPLFGSVAMLDKKVFRNVGWREWEVKFWKLDYRLGGLCHSTSILENEWACTMSQFGIFSSNRALGRSSAQFFNSFLMAFWLLSWSLQDSGIIFTSYFVSTSRINKSIKKID